MYIHTYLVLIYIDICSSMSFCVRVHGLKVPEAEVKGADPNYIHVGSHFPFHQRS